MGTLERGIIFIKVVVLDFLSTNKISGIFIFLRFVFKIDESNNKFLPIGFIIFLLIFPREVLKKTPILKTGHQELVPLKRGSPVYCYKPL